MPINLRNYAITTDAAGAGTATGLIRGEVIMVRMPLAGTAITATGGTTDFTVIDSYGGGTILSLSNANAPWEYTPGRQLWTTTAGSAIYAAGTPVYVEGYPVAGTVTVTVTSGQPSKSGTIYVLSRI